MSLVLLCFAVAQTWERNADKREWQRLMASQTDATAAVSEAVDRFQNASASMAHTLQQNHDAIAGNGRAIQRFADILEHFGKRLDAIEYRENATRGRKDEDL